MHADPTFRVRPRLIPILREHIADDCDGFEWMLYEHPRRPLPGDAESLEKWIDWETRMLESLDSGDFVVPPGADDFAVELLRNLLDELFADDRYDAARDLLEVLEDALGVSIDTQKVT